MYNPSPVSICKALVPAVLLLLLPAVYVCEICDSPLSIWPWLSLVCELRVSSGCLATAQSLLAVSLPVRPELATRLDPHSAHKYAK